MDNDRSARWVVAIFALPVWSLIVSVLIFLRRKGDLPDPRAGSARSERWWQVDVGQVAEGDRSCRAGRRPPRRRQVAVHLAPILSPLVVGAFDVPDEGQRRPFEVLLGDLDLQLERWEPFFDTVGLTAGPALSI